MKKIELTKWERAKLDMQKHKFADKLEEIEKTNQAQREIDQLVKSNPELAWLVLDLGGKVKDMPKEIVKRDGDLYIYERTRCPHCKKMPNSEEHALKWHFDNCKRRTAR